MTNRVAADLIIHGLSAAVLFPEPYRGKGTPAGWKVTEERDVSIAVQDGIIVWIGPAAEMSERVNILRDADFVNGHGLTAIPGFVDSHTHLVYAGDRSDEFEMRVAGRSYLDILAAGGGILRSVSAVRELSEDELFREAEDRLWKLIASGVTTVEIKTGYGLDLDSEMKMLRVTKRLADESPIRIVSTFMGAHAVPKERRDNPDAFTAEICEKWIPEVARSGLAQFNDVFCENKAFNLEQSRRILECGKRHGLKPKIHADEVNVIGGVDLAVEIGAVSADHLLKTGQTGISRLSGSGVVPTLLPGTSTYLMESHHAPAREMIAAGLPVAIASDHNPGSCQFLAATLIQSLAMLQLRMTAGEALIAGTLHGAHALDIGDKTGAIEVGRRADIVLLRAGSYRQVGYRIGDQLVDTVIAHGMPVWVAE